MPKITKKQIEKINNGCLNGFYLDLEYFLLHNEKQLVKYEDTDDTHKLEYCLSYFPEYEKVTQSNGISYNVSTDKYLITLRVSKWIKSNIGNNVWKSQGLGKTITLSQLSVPRRKVSVLQKYTHDLTEDKLRKLNDYDYSYEM